MRWLYSLNYFLLNLLCLLLRKGYFHLRAKNSLWKISFISLFCISLQERQELNYKISLCICFSYIYEYLHKTPNSPHQLHEFCEKRLNAPPTSRYRIEPHTTSERSTLSAFSKLDMIAIFTHDVWDMCGDKNEVGNKLNQVLYRNGIQLYH